MKQFLTLMLAFVMVFTGMGIGSWGVDEAWADGNVYVVKDVIGISQSDLPENAQFSYSTVNNQKSDEFPIRGAGTLIGKYKNINLYNIELEGLYDKVQLGRAIVNYTNPNGTYQHCTGYVSGDIVTGKKPATQGFTVCTEQIIAKDDDTYTQAKNFFDAAKNTSDFQLDNGVNIDKNAGYIMFAMYTGRSVTSIDGYFIVKLGEGGESVSTTEIDELLKTAPSIENDDTYWHESDRYNGNLQLNSLISKLKINEKISNDSDVVALLKENYTSFWKLYETAMNRVNTIYPETDGERKLTDGVTQTQVDAAAALLDSAIANLIPTSEINATELYEAVNKTIRYTEDTATPASWAAYEKAKEKGEALLGKLYQDGKATLENKSTVENEEGKQVESKMSKDVKAATTALTSAIDGLDARISSTGADSDLPDAEYRYDLMKVLVQKYEPQTEEEKYTPKSREALEKAIADARKYIANHEKPTKEFGKKAYAELQEVYAALRNANEELRDTKKTEDDEDDTITVTVKVVDNYQVKYAGSDWVKTLGIYTIPLGENRTFKYLKEKLKTEQDKWGNLDSTGSFGALYRNGILVDDASTLTRKMGLNSFDSPVFDKVVLRDGDEITLARLAQPTKLGSSGAGYDAAWSAKELYDAIRSTKLSGSKELNEGEAGSYHAEAMAAHISQYTGRAISLANAKVFVSSQPAQTDKAVLAANQDTEVVTDENGNFSYTFYEEGYYALSVYDMGVTQDKLSYSLTAGDTMIVHVTKADAAGIEQTRQDLLAELEAGYNRYPESYFTAENWKTITDAYEEGKTAIKAADTLIEAKAALDNALSIIESVQQAAEAVNDTTLSNFQYRLKPLPQDVSLLTKRDITAVQELIESYEALSEYGKTQMTASEDEKYQGIVKAYGKDGSSLPEAKKYKITIKNAADNEADLAVLQRLFAEMAKVEDWIGEDLCQVEGKGVDEAYPRDWINYLSYYRNIELTGPLDFRAKMTEENFGYTYKNLKDLINGNEYEVKYFLVNGEKVDKASLTMQMPYEDLTITAVYGAKERADSSETVAERLKKAKAAATAALNTAFEEYKQGDYSEANWADLVAKKDAGLTAIENAEKENDAAKAAQDAIKAMAAILTIAQEKDDSKTTGGESGVKLPDYGNVVGKVHIIVENTTYTEAAKDGSYGAPAWYGTLIDGYYNLCEKDTMMTAVLKALQLKGCSWSTGSQGKADSWDDYGITYIASIKLKEGMTSGNGLTVNSTSERLGEFSGASGSGWMGTLNDWFTNFGFAEFGYQNGELKDGDEIHIMFTQNLGVDLGGTWDNSDTSLKDLAITGAGTLKPSFSSSKKEYAYILSNGKDAKLTVTPTASNKNYQTRIYLNNYMKDSAEYRRTSKVPVKAGDILYVGCGEYAWPSMNKQGAESRSYSGTKYTIKVCASMSEYVKGLLEAMISADKITYTNYKSYQEEVTTAASAYDGLSASEKKDISDSLKTKLEKARAQINFYAQIDDVKAKFAALKTNSSESAAKAAYEAYKKLSDEQKKYITVADTKTYNELAKKYNISSIAGAAEMPESNVNTSGKTTTTVIEAKVSEGKASASVDKETLTKMKKQVIESKSTDLVLEVPKDAKGSEVNSVSLSVDTATLKEMAEKQDFNLTVKGETGHVKLDSAALKDALTQAGGSELTIIIEKKNLDESGRKLLGENAQGYTLTIKSGNKVISHFGGNVTVSLEIPDSLAGKKVAAVYIDSAEKFTHMPGSKKTISGKAYYVFTTTHFSDFALVDADALGIEVADEDTLTQVKSLVSDLKLVARSEKTAKKNIKVTLKKSAKTTAAIKEIKDLGYTVKYRFYRSTKKSAGYKSAVTKKTANYTNTSGKKNTKYFYKVQVRVYDENGKLVAKTALKQCKYASRTWTKKK